LALRRLLGSLDDLDGEAMAAGSDAENLRPVARNLP